MRRHRRNPAGGGFTMLELMVVISIIIILVGIVVGAGVGIVGGRTKSVTQSVLLTLDRALEEYIQANNGAQPPFIAFAYAESPGLDLRPGDKENSPNVDTGTQTITGGSFAFTEYPKDGNVFLPRFPDAAVFVRQATGYGEVDTILSGLEQWLQPTASSTVRGAYAKSQTAADDTTPSVLDAWADGSWRGNGDTDWPILGSHMVLYVHPNNHLAQALYGRCKNGRPYFMSAGPDGYFGVTNEFSLEGAQEASPEAILKAIKALEDNIYSYQPDPPLGLSGSEDDQLNDPFNKDYR